MTGLLHRDYKVSTSIQDNARLETRVSYYNSLIILDTFTNSTYIEK
jgi:hypothetical protein